MRMHRRFLEFLVVLAAIALLIWGRGMTRGDSGVGFRDRWSPEVVTQVAVMQATVDYLGRTERDHLAPIRPEGGSNEWIREVKVAGASPALIAACRASNDDVFSDLRELDLKGVKFPKEGYSWRLYAPVVVGDEAIAQVVQEEPIPHVFVTGQMLLAKQDGTWRVIQSKRVGAGESEPSWAPTGTP